MERRFDLLHQTPDRPPNVPLARFLIMVVIVVVLPGRFFFVHKVENVGCVSEMALDGARF